MQRRVEVDRTLKEHLQYRDTDFPMEVFVDAYEYLMDHTLNCHWHHEYEFGLLAEGELDYYISDMKLRLRAGDCVFIDANTMHMAEQVGERNAVMVVVAFSPSLLVSSMNSRLYQKYFRQRPVHGFLVDQEQEEGAEIVRLLRELHALREEQFGYELLCMSRLSLLWYTTLGYIGKNCAASAGTAADSQSEARAKEIMSYIREHYTEELTVEQIAACANISQSECFRCFKRYTQRSPIQYVNEYRLLRAAQMLLDSSDSVTGIGLSCGFSNASYFCKQFKSKYGVSPAQYRKRLR